MFIYTYIYFKEIVSYNAQLYKLQAEHIDL